MDFCRYLVFSLDVALTVHFIIWPLYLACAGNVFEPRGLDELIPDWRERGAPVASPVTEDSFSFLTESKAYKIPNFLLPPQLVRFYFSHGIQILHDPERLACPAVGKIV